MVEGWTGAWERVGTVCFHVETCVRWTRYMVLLLLLLLLQCTCSPSAS